MFWSRRQSVDEQHDLTYEIDDGVLCVEGRYALKAEFEFALDEDDPISND